MPPRNYKAVTIKETTINQVKDFVDLTRAKYQDIKSVSGFVEAAIAEKLKREQEAGGAPS